MAPASAHPSSAGSSVLQKDVSPDDLNIFGDVAQAKDAYVPDSHIPSLSEIKAHIPAHCFRPSLARSVYYVARDFFYLAVLYYGAYRTYGTSWQWVYVPFFWFFGGFVMWAMFVLGHDCGHGSFSRYKSVNSFFGHLLHSFILVPFHSWRISHRKHHKNTGNFEKDEIFYPMPEHEYAGVHTIARMIYKELYFLAMFAYPVYLVKGYGNAMQRASHFSPTSELFTKDERPLIVQSVACWSAMFSLLVGFAVRYGVVNVLVYYVVPNLIFCAWLLVVTFLHHTEPGTRWYNTKNWTYVKGNLESIDRVYGWFEHFHHDIGYHVVHHLFPAIPHYHLREATAAVKPYLGDLHKVERQTPLKQLGESFHAWQHTHVVPDQTDLFVIPDPNTSKKVE